MPDPPTSIVNYSSDYTQEIPAVVGCVKVVGLRLCRAERINGWYCWKHAWEDIKNARRD